MAKKQIEEAAQEFIEQEEQANGSLGNVNTISRAGSKGFNQKEDNDYAKEIGFKLIPLESLPSQGLFYPSGTKIFIKAASGAEVKHWSTIDEEDHYSIDEVLNYVVERCIRINIPGQRASYKDIKDVDRFWLIFAIREYTFKDGENKLVAEIPNNQGVIEKVEVTKDVISYYNPSEKMMQFYNEEDKCFTFNLKTGEVVNLYLPSVGISSFLSNMRQLKQMQRQKIDEDFARYSMFIFKDWKGLTEDMYKNEEQKSVGWSIGKISLLAKFVEFVKESVNPSMTVSLSDGEVTVPLNFRGGLKAIFLVSDILDELI
jgi:hypothetical protein